MYAALEVEEKVPGRYGWGKYTPDCLQVFTSPKWATAFFCMASLFQGIIVNGLLHYFLPMIERRFLMSSTQSGFMSGAYDIAATLFLLPVTYIGGSRRAHKPRCIGNGVLIMGMGSLVFSSPAFFVGPYRYGVLQELCTPFQKKKVQPPDENYNLFFWILFFGNFLHGVGASPLYTLVITFIDTSVPLNHSSVYLGVYYMMAVIGPFIGIASGGGLSQVDGDYLIYSRKSSISSDLTPDSPAWIGSWWLGFIICGVACLIFAWPILGLPRELPETQTHRAERERMRGGAAHMTFYRIADFPKAMFQIISNTKFLFITLGGCCEGIIFSGMGAFLTKILHQQFGLSPSEVATYMSVIVIPSTLGGILFGGWIIKHRQMNLQQILTMTVCLMALALPCVGGLFISCPSLHIAGVTVPYSQDKQVKGEPAGKASLISDCNKDCGCDESNFSPICGNDNIEYFSACYAGCTEKKYTGAKKVYRNCSCILTKGKDGTDAKNLPCKQDCPLFPLFVCLLFLYQLLSFSTLIPAVTSTLRVVDVDSGSLALGVQWLLGRALGTIPGPVMFGAVIDKACIHWSPKAGVKESGNCLLYDSFILSRVVDVDSGSLALGVQWLLGRALGTIPGPVMFGAVIDKACIHWSPKAGVKESGNCLLYDSFILSRNIALVIFCFKFLEILSFSVALILAKKNP